MIIIIISLVFFLIDSETLTTKSPDNAAFDIKAEQVAYLLKTFTLISEIMSSFLMDRKTAKLTTYLRSCIKPKGSRSSSAFLNFPDLSRYLFKAITIHKRGVRSPATLPHTGYGPVSNGSVSLNS